MLLYFKEKCSTFANAMNGFRINEKGLVGTLLRSAGVRNFAKLLSANVVAQVIGLVVYPVLTRMYAPDDFGLLNLFLSIGGVLVILATAEYQYAIVLPKEDEKAHGVLQTGGLIALCVTGIVLLSVPFSHPIASIFKTPSLAKWYWLMPVYVLASACWILLNYYYTRHKQFGRISCYQISQSVLNAGAKVGCGYAGFLHGGLICSTVLAPVVAVLISIARSWRKGLREVLHVDKNVCKEVAKEYGNFPKYSLPRALVNNLSGSLPALLLTPFFGLTNLGFWGMAITLAFRPINMISQSLYQVLFQHVAAKVNRRETIRPILQHFCFRVMGLTIICFTGLYFVLPWLTQWLLGEEWEITGHYIRVMLPWLTMSMLVAPICFLSDVFQKQKTGLLLEILLVMARLTGMLIGVWTKDFYCAVMGYSLASSIAILMQAIWYACLVRDYERSISH